MSSPRFPSSHVSRYFDRIAIGLSAICIVHCLAVPLVVAVLPIAALTLGDDSHFHRLMLWLVVPTSVAAFALGYRVHRRAGVVAVAAMALVALAAAAIWGHERWGLAAETAVSVLASVALACAHWVNFREVRRRHRHG